MSVGRSGGRASDLVWGSEQGPYGEVNHFAVPRELRLLDHAGRRPLLASRARRTSSRAVYVILHRHGLARWPGPGNILIKVGAEAGQAIRELGTVDKALGDTMSSHEKMARGSRRPRFRPRPRSPRSPRASIAAAKAAAEDAAAREKMIGNLERTTGATRGASGRARRLDREAHDRDRRRRRRPPAGALEARRVDARHREGAGRAQDRDGRLRGDRQGPRRRRRRDRQGLRRLDRRPLAARRRPRPDDAQDEGHDAHHGQARRHDGRRDGRRRPAPRPASTRSSRTR